MVRVGTPTKLAWAIPLAAFCLAVAGCDLLSDDDSSSADVLPGGIGGITITLEWTTTADLDLHVTDPDGETIYFAHPSSESGGLLDTDDTDGGDADVPGSETISWDLEDVPEEDPEDTLEGTYEVEVDHFSGASPSGYTVVVQQAGFSQTYTGTLELGEMVSVVTFEYGTGLPEPSSRAAIRVERPKDRRAHKP